MNKSPKRAWIAPVFLPHLGCPHRCVFCNQHWISGQRAAPSPDEVRGRLDLHLRRARDSFSRRRQIAFYGGNFMGLSPDLQRAYLGVAGEFFRTGRVDSVRISTRPDEICPDRLRYLAEEGVATIEIGVQSLSDRVLHQTRRGHTARQSVEAIGTVKQSGLEVGAQIMVGLPGDSGEESLATAAALCRLRPDFVRIYPLLVLRGTELAQRMAAGSYRPWQLEETVALCSRMLEQFEAASIPVVRIGLQGDVQMAGPEGAVLAGPYHAAFGFLVRSELFGRRARSALSGMPAPAGCVLRIHPHDRPLLSGDHGRTWQAITSEAGFGRVVLEEDWGIPRGRVVCAPAGCPPA